MGMKCMESLLCDIPKEKSMECMRAQSAERLNEACRLWLNPDGYLSKPGFYMSGYDGELLPHTIKAPLCEKQKPANGDVPAMSGALDHEWRFFDYRLKSISTGPRMAERLLKEHVPMAARSKTILNVLKEKLFGDKGVFSAASCVSSGCKKMSLAAPLQMASNQYGMGVLFPLSGGGEGKRYRYKLNIDLGGSALGSGHCGDLCMLFSSKPWLMPFQKGACGNGTHQTEWIKLAKTMRKMWTDFAKTGSPSPDWNPLMAGKRAPLMSMALGKEPTMTSNVPFSEDSERVLVKMICGTM